MCFLCFETLSIKANKQKLFGIAKNLSLKAPDRVELIGAPEQQRLHGVAKSTLGVALVKPSQHHAVRTYRPRPLHR